MVKVGKRLQKLRFIRIFEDERLKFGQKKTKIGQELRKLNFLISEAVRIHFESMFELALWSVVSGKWPGIDKMSYHADLYFELMYENHNNSMEIVHQNILTWNFWKKKPITQRSVTNKSTRTLQSLLEYFCCLSFIFKSSIQTPNLSEWIIKLQLKSEQIS